MHIGVDRVFVVAEMSCNHAGNKDTAHAIIDAAFDAGADAIKVQIDNPDGGIAIDIDSGDFLIDEGPWRGRTLYGLYRETSMPWEWLPKLRDHAQAKGLVFFASVSCNASLFLAMKMLLPIIKISSFEARDIPLIRKAMRYGKPIIVSCGCDWLDAWELLQGYDAYFLYCVSQYPASADQFDLGKCAEFDGISDHSMGNAITYAAVARGARIVERHLTMDRAIPTADSGFSLVPGEFAEMVNGIRAIEQSMVPKQDRYDMQFCKSVYAIADIAKGDAFGPWNVACIRPGYGLHPRYYEELLTRRAKTSLHRGDRITEWML